jgi:hypothetical protein
VIDYETFSGDLRRVTVRERVPQIKNGRDGFDAINHADGMAVWGYDSQIVRIVERGAA